MHACTSISPFLPFSFLPSHFLKHNGHRRQLTYTAGTGYCPGRLDRCCGWGAETQQHRFILGLLLQTRYNEEGRTTWWPRREEDSHSIWKKNTATHIMSLLHHRPSRLSLGPWSCKGHCGWGQAGSIFWTRRNCSRDDLECMFSIRHGSWHIQWTDKRHSSDWTIFFIVPSRTVLVQGPDSRIWQYRNWSLWHGTKDNHRQGNITWRPGDHFHLIFWRLFISFRV